MRTQWYCWWNSLPSSVVYALFIFSGAAAVVDSYSEVVSEEAN